MYGQRVLGQLGHRLRYGARTGTQPACAWMDPMAACTEPLDATLAVGPLFALAEQWGGACKRHRQQE